MTSSRSTVWYNRPIAACKLEFQNMHCYCMAGTAVRPSNPPRRVNQSASEKNNLISQALLRQVSQSFNHSISKLTDQSRSQVKQTIASPRASEDGVMLGKVCQHMTAWSTLIYFVSRILISVGPPPSPPNIWRGVCRLVRGLCRLGTWGAGVWMILDQLMSIYFQ